MFPRAADAHRLDFASVHLSGDTAAARLGRDDRGGQISVEGPNAVIQVQGISGGIIAQEGILRLGDISGSFRLILNGREGHVVFGGDGEVGIRDENNVRTIFLNGATANAAFGASGNAGAVFVKDDSGEDAIILNGATANAALGRDSNAGALYVKDASGSDSITLNGDTANVSLGRTGNGGDLSLRNDQGQETVLIRGTKGNMGIGSVGTPGSIFVKNDQGENNIHLSGQTGDILLRNADCAEAFETADPEAEPGDVMVISGQDVLRRCCNAYDRRVAGILSGAGLCRPAIVLNQIEQDPAHHPLALVGKVYCKVDADYGAVSIGDLLTTSQTPGHAMKASDPQRAFGAVIGKALQARSEGRGVITVLVGLQ